MSIHFIIGINGKGSGATFDQVYLGQSGSEARAAMEANTTATRFIVYGNGSTYQKNNSRFAGDTEPPPAQINEAPAPAKPRKGK